MPRNNQIPQNLGCWNELLFGKVPEPCPAERFVKGRLARIRRCGQQPVTWYVWLVGTFFLIEISLSQLHYYIVLYSLCSTMFFFSLMVQASELGVVEQSTGYVCKKNMYIIELV